MNKYILFLLSFFLMSCNDYLTQLPKSDLSKDQFFDDPNQIKYAVNALYREGASTFYQGGSYEGAPIMYGGYLSGLYDNTYKGQYAFIQYLQTLIYTSENISAKLEDVWFKCYKEISNANFVVSNIEKVTDLSEEEKDKLKAEALFFRAFNYFYLVRNFGGVPLITEAYEGLDNIYVPRATVKEIYNLIEEDLLFATKTGLPNKAFTQGGFRITQGAAEMLLADVYLNMSGYPLLEDHYRDAAKYARKIIKDARHSLLSHDNFEEASAYNKIRKLDNADEYIYTFEYNNETFKNNARGQYAIPSVGSSWGIFKYGTTNIPYEPTPELLRFFDRENDLRVQEYQYIYSSYSYEKKGELITREFSPAPYWYFEEEAALVTGIGQKDDPIYRYSETLLIAAEAIAQSEGVTSEAVDYLSRVRSRAYVKEPVDQLKRELSSLSKEQFIKEVWAERIREFLFEYKIWNDIQRTRKYPTNGNNKGKVDFVDFVGAKNPMGATYKEHNLLFPIPFYEMQRNPSLEQNPGYY
ncbi:RagB/SusD family nutrient uptake outer membrane protein [Parabacteroides distasonis]|uniref:RagB/SusD family nutrient uptake outer membrane protein n=1 Tax=Parabacteroides distasonis TaxID=823 RepID=UPI0018972CE3|nr:RagB/SusD family nutrient uptake outer membrane protein [Parabacteroides distasonis]MDB8996243.1 RagB/SusD family nutrient uptake outer membrane protein [Parabacteroides distasonis]MDB9072286.1 RagB/SusD family nutrient uptake outer membrane protein [Parabacteroides distasonis]